MKISYKNAISPRKVLLSPGKQSEYDRRNFLKIMASGLLGSVTIGTGSSAVSAWTGINTNSVLNQARTDARELRIKSVKPYIMRLQRGVNGELSGTHFVFARVETEDGLVGWGDGSSWPNVVTIASEIEMIGPRLVGRSAFDTEGIYNFIQGVRSPSHGASVQSCISAIDIALWDIIGQKLNVPVYQLLGGKVNPRIKIYTSYRWGKIEPTREAYAQRTKELIAEGALAGKWDPFIGGLEPNRNLGMELFNRVVQMVQGVREGGPNFEICVEGHGKFNVHGAIRMAKALEPYNVLFFEEPVMPENADALREVQRSTSTPLAVGERLKGRLEAREYIEKQAMRIIQPDAVRCGGITEFRKMVYMAESQFMTFSPHNPNSPVGTAAHLHLATSSASFLILEEGIQQPDAYKAIFQQWDGGLAYWQVPEKPGLGVHITDEFLREHSIPIDKAERTT